jgi:hypothetical protein
VLPCAALVAALGGCGATQARPIGSAAAAKAIGTAFDRPLVDNVITGADATTDHIAASFTGGDELEHLVAVVFDRSSGSRVLTGSGGLRRIAGRDPVDVIRVANVVVLYSRAPGITDRTSAFRSALRGLAGAQR